MRATRREQGNRQDPQRARSARRRPSGSHGSNLVGHGISLSPPDQTQVTGINRLIYDELMLGNVTRESERLLKTFITNIAKDDVQAIVLGCTELEMIVTDANILPIYNGARIHADAAVEWIFGENS
jgi:aspartate racemase